MIINKKTKKKNQKKENEHTVLIFIKRIKNKNSGSLREGGLYDQHSSCTVDIKKLIQNISINKKIYHVA